METVQIINKISFVCFTNPGLKCWIVSRLVYKYLKGLGKIKACLLLRFTRF